VQQLLTSHQEKSQRFHRLGSVCKTIYHRIRFKS